MIKKFNEMYAIDVLPFCDERKDGQSNVTYLNWAMCKKLLHDNGAEVVYFEPLTNASGSTLFMSDKEFRDKADVVNRCYEVRVKIVIDDLVFTQNYPLLNGVNPVKDNSMNQLRLANAQARAFVKGVAVRTGLGFQLWCQNDETTAVEQSVQASSILKVKELAQEEYTRLLAVKHMSADEIFKALNLPTFESLKAKFSMFDDCLKFITDMQKL